VSAAINDGGPAFPSTGEEYDQDNDRWRVVTSGGMSLRDYFAAKALVGVMLMVADGCHQPQIDDLPIDQKDFIALSAYRIADAMLKARES
jgi:hypothetical protein